MALPSWLQRNGGQETPPDPKADEEYEKKLTGSISDKVKADIGGEIDTRVANILANDPVLKKLAKTLEASEQRATEEAERRRVAAEQKEQGNTEEFEKNMDPETMKYLENKLAPITNSALRAEAQSVKRNLFEDVEAFPYYTGPMKTKIDEMIEKEPLNLQGNPTLIRNAYKVVLADHFEQIQKGEIRSRLASAAGSGTQSGKPSGSTPADELPSLNADQKKAASMFGISEKEYATEMKNMELGVL